MILEEIVIGSENVTLPLRILLIKDSQYETESIVRWLQKEVPQIYYERVNSPESLRRLLVLKKWDLILSDFNLQSFSVLSALQIIKEQAIDIPFIVVSNPVKGIDIVTAMKAGVHDFIPKNNLIRLLSAINSEIQDADYRSNHKVFEQDLQQEKSLLESANQRKSRVLAFVAHEFRNPLNAALMFGRLLEKEKSGPLTDKQKEFVHNMMAACEHLKDLVDDILDIAPIETGHFTISTEIIALPNILSTVKAVLQGAADKKNIKLLIEVQDDITWIQADSKRLKQILINLVSNAIKYTSVNDTVSLTVFKENEQWITYEVKDHGPGINEHELEQLCSDYYRVKNSFSSQEEGLGLGLALTKKLVEAHQGLFEIESTVGIGSVFLVKLPVLGSATI